MAHVPEPYYVSDHAVMRFQDRIADLPRHTIVVEVQNALQGKRVEDRDGLVRLYVCDYKGVAYYPVVGPPDKPRLKEWPVVASVLSAKEYDPRTYRFYGVKLTFETWSTRGPHVWRNGEDNYLRKWYGVLDTQRIARHLGRTVKAVQERARRLGIQLIRRRPWTRAEKQIMKLMYSKYTAQDIAWLLGRSTGAVRVQATRMKLTERRFAPIEKAQLNEVITVCMHMQEAIKRGSIRVDKKLKQDLEKKGVVQVVLDRFRRKAQAERRPWISTA